MAKSRFASIGQSKFTYLLLSLLLLILIHPLFEGFVFGRILLAIFFPSRYSETSKLTYPKRG